MLLYVERWLKAPLQDSEGEVVPRNVGTPQGGVISPLLANLFLHYAYDKSSIQGMRLEINAEKSRIVYCKDANRPEAHEDISFEFLGFTFRPRRCVSKKYGIHPNFLPAISRSSMKAINREIRSWHVQLKNDKSLENLFKMFNLKVLIMVDSIHRHFIGFGGASTDI